MTDPTPSQPPGGERPRRRQLRVLSLTTLLALVLSLNLVLPGGLGAVAGMLPDDGQPASSLLQASTPEPEDAVSGDRSTADIAEQANPAVVTIYSRGLIDNPFGGQGGQTDPVFPGAPGNGSVPEQTSIGSGFIVDDEGHVVTNSHVVADGDEFLVEFADGTTATATLVGADAYQDVAVLLLDLEDGQSVPSTLAFGDSDAARPGDDVIAIGTPLGEFTNSVSAGVVGGVNRSLGGPGGSLDNLIQHDAPISSGNSGGPLLNRNGEVIGINVAKATASGLSAASADGLGFAIASNAAATIVEQLIADGSVTRPFLGIEGQALPEGHGVASVGADSPADRASLQRGDIITAVDGEPIADNQSLQSVLYAHVPGDTITLTVERDGESLSLDVTLSERPSDLQ